MANERQRDRAIEHVLRRGVAAPRPPETSATCLDGETLAAWSSGALAAAEAARVEEHLADCARCQSMLAAFVRTEPMAVAPSPWWQRARIRWLVPLATAATVAAIWVAIPRRPDAPPHELAQSAAPDSRGRAQSQPGMAPYVAPPTAVPESAPADAQRFEPNRETAAASAAPQQKAQPAEQRTEADTRATAGGRAANEPAAPTPAPIAPASPPAAPPSQTMQTESARDATGERRLARAAAVEIVSADGAARWRIVDGQVQRSTPSGNTWERVPLGSSAMAAGHAPVASVLWVVGKAGAIFVTADGARFEQVPFVAIADLVAVTATDDRQATVTAADGRRFLTTDRGRTWIPQ